MTARIFIRRLRRLPSQWRQHGTVGLIRHILRHRRHILTAPHKNDAIGFYSFVYEDPYGQPIGPDDVVSTNTINWFIPPFGPSAGGHMTIFRTISGLEKRGFECRIILVGDVGDRTPSDVKYSIDEFFVRLKAEVFIGRHNAPKSHISMATSWHTAYDVRDFQGTRYRGYFVQDFEPHFYPVGSESVFAEQTYRFGFFGITAGDWLAKILADEYGMATRPFGFSYDRHIYYPTNHKESYVNKSKKVFFYARPVTPRRGFEFGLLVMKELTKRLPDVQVVFAGWDISNYSIPFHHHNAGSVSPSDLAVLFNECDAALILSLTNLSLMPLELMACETPLVSNRGNNTEWLLNESNCVLADMSVESMADALQEVLEKNELRANIIEGGRKTIANTDWDREAGRVADALREFAPSLEKNHDMDRSDVTKRG